MNTLSPGQIRRSIDYANAIYWLDTDPARSLAILRQSHHDLPCGECELCREIVNEVEILRGGTDK